MALEKQVIDYNFSGGEMQGANPLLLDAPFITDSANLAVEKAGELRKRLGYQTLEAVVSEAESTGHTLFTAPKDSLSVLDMVQGVYSISTLTRATTRLKLSEAAVKPCEITSDRFLSPANGVIYCDSAVLETAAGERYICVCWAEDDLTGSSGYRVYATVVEEATGTVVVSKTQLPDGYRYARVVAVGYGDGVTALHTTFVVVYETTSTLPTPSHFVTGISYAYCDVTVDSPSFTTVALTGVSFTSGRWDLAGAQMSGGGVAGDKFYLFGANNTTGSLLSVEVGATLATPVAAVGTVTTTTATQLGVAVSVSPRLGIDRIYIAWTAGGNQLWQACYTDAGVAVYGTTLHTLLAGEASSYVTVVERDNVGGVLVCASGDPSDGTHDATNWRKVVYLSCDAFGSIAGSVGYVEQCALASKGFRPPGQNAGVCVFPVSNQVMYGETEQLMYIYLDLCPDSLRLTPRGHFQRDFALPLQGNQVDSTRYNQNLCYLPSVTTHWNVPIPNQAPYRDWTFYGAFPFSDDTAFDSRFTQPYFLRAKGGIALTRINCWPKPLKHARMNSTEYFEGGLFSAFDRYLSFESTPLRYPEVRSITVQSAGADILADDAYLVLWYFKDQNGVIHRSAVAPEAVSSGVAANTNRVLFDPPPPSVSDTSADADDSLWLAALYRTTDGSTYYLVASGRPSTSNQYRYFDDSAASSGLAGAGYTTLYTEGGILPAYCPPPLLDMVSWDGRLVAINGDDTEQVLFTKQVAPLVSPEWNPDLSMSSVSAAGPFTALAVLDDKLICFKRNAIFFQVGQGPTSTGLGFYPALNRLAADVGCVDRASVTTGDFGVVFQSRRGITLLGRDLTLTYIGQGVEDTLADYPHIQRAHVVPEHSEVRFLCSNTERAQFPSATNGTVYRILAWDYLHNCWHVRIPPSMRDLASWQDSEVALRPSSAILQESTSVYYDTDNTGTDDAGTFTTPWYKPAGPQGACRVFSALLHGKAGASVSATTRIEVAYDYESTFPETHVVDTLSGSTRFSIDIRPGRQQCNAIRFRITEVAQPPATKPGEWARFSGISLVVGVNEGVHPLATRTT